jgi:peptidoglycan/LPS O-acetylase OafA/YrhL
MHIKNQRFDFLRLFAAWLVLFNHSYPLSGISGIDIATRHLRLDTSGGLGVSIFFALSGYLVCLSVENSKSPLDFFRRRLFRIYPALILLCIVSIFVVGPAFSKLSLISYFSHPATLQYAITATAFKISYILPGVFDNNPLKGVVNGSLWSLAYEVKCYLVLAALFWIPFLNLRTKLLASLVFLTVLYIVRPSSIPVKPFETYLGFDYYANRLGLIFCVGAILASLRKMMTPRRWHFFGVMSSVGLCLAWNYPASLLGQLCYLYCIPAFILWLAQFARWLPRISPRIGDLSYGVYLYGFPAQQVLSHYGIQNQGIVMYVVCSTILTFTLALCSWHCLEKHAISLKYKNP